MKITQHKKKLTPGELTRHPEDIPSPDDPRKASELSELKRPYWIFGIKQAVKRFSKEQCTDLAAALTYYSILSLFPSLIALISLVGIFGQGESTVNEMTSIVARVAPESVVETVKPILDQLVTSNAAGFALILGIGSAIWGASGYVGAFGRALNKMHSTGEGRPFLKLKGRQLLVTLMLLTLAGCTLMGLIISGPVAQFVGSLLGFGEGAVTIWNIAKWPIIVIMIVLIIASLYYFSPNVRQPRFRWLSPGALLALIIWVIASLGFAFYVKNFASYDKTYGALAGVVVFLLWIWITNLALLFGAALDVEVERARQLQAGFPAEQGAVLPPKTAESSGENLSHRVTQPGSIFAEAEATRKKNSPARKVKMLAVGGLAIVLLKRRARERMR